ncbi:oxidoreductase [Siminovitchia terrae]|uniref:Oxidoreductase n=1 Tax=Siminovitchia terrae TaxID=1914933 RepID=A0ABQ4KRX8_SIMTE|nr:FAD-binding oxidoreductase [Siminovitchia terrae]GIN94787.1 oxidoreductase [Siminovitchia terrae]
MNTMSLWEATANTGNARPSLEGEHHADVVIIGAGFTGLSAAYHLQKKGLSSIVVEQNTVGWGASGRNGGMILPGYKPTMGELTKKYGLEEAKQLNQIALDGMELVKDIIEQHKIECSLDHGGYLLLSEKKRFKSMLIEETEMLNRQFGSNTKYLEGYELKQEIDSPYFSYGLMDPHSYSFHPLNYALGLADAAELSGAKIYENTKACDIQRASGNVTVSTEKGKVIAKEVIAATDGYSSSLTKQLDRAVIPVASYLVATERLGKDLAESLIPNNRMVFDTSNVINYFRRSPDGRMVYGGSGMRHTGHEKYYRELQQKMVTVFPQLSDHKIEYKWGGLIGVTMDMFPMIGKMEDGVYFATGYCGHGASFATLLGQMLSQWITGEERVSRRFESIPLRSFPFSSQKSMLINLANCYYRVVDAIT